MSYLDGKQTTAAQCDVGVLNMFPEGHTRDMALRRMPFSQIIL